MHPMLCSENINAKGAPTQGEKNAYKVSTTPAYPRGGGDLPLPAPYRVSASAQ